MRYQTTAMLVIHREIEVDCDPPENAEADVLQWPAEYQETFIRALAAKLTEEITDTTSDTSNINNVFMGCVAALSHAMDTLTFQATPCAELIELEDITWQTP